MTHDRFSPYYLHQRHSSIPSFNVTDRMQPNSISLGQVWEREAQTNPAQTVDIEERIENLDGVDERTLIKEELRLSIQSRRIARGLPGNVEIEYKKPLAEEVSAEDLLKRERRRERNKVAAAKCRFKKKIVSERLQEESDQLEHLNMKLHREIERLQEEKQKLSTILELHRPSCVAERGADQKEACSTPLSSLLHSSVQHFGSENQCCPPPMFDSSFTVKLTQSC